MMGGFSIPMAARHVTVLAPASVPRASAHDAVHHVGARFGVDVRGMSSHVTEAGLRATTAHISGTATGVANALRALSHLELTRFLR